MGQVVTRYERTVYAGVAAFIGGRVVFLVWAAAGSRSPDFNIWFVLRGVLAGSLIAGALGWFCGERVLDWLSECLPTRPPGR